MTTGKEMTIRQSEVGIFLPPDIVLENARTAAKALADVISQKANPVIINSERYLEFEDWELLGQFYGYSVSTGDAVPVEIDGVKGAKANADVIELKTGIIIGGAQAYCMRDEERWNTRPAYEWQGEGDDRQRIKVADEPVPWFQLASMAQTRAGAKALRNRLAWVAVLAGYKPTPAEEMSKDTVSSKAKARTVDPSQHYCLEHKVNFFKTGKMKGYAHPIRGTKEWCNELEPDVETPTSTSEESQPEASKPESKTMTPTAPVKAVEKGILQNWDKFQETVTKLNWQNGIRDYIFRQFDEVGDDELYLKDSESGLKEIVSRLTLEQQNQLGREMKARLTELPKK